MNQTGVSIQENLETAEWKQEGGYTKTFTFSFDKQDGCVSVGGSLHLSNQRFLLFIFFFFRLDKRTCLGNGTKNRFMFIMVQ